MIIEWIAVILLVLAGFDLALMHLAAIIRHLSTYL